MVKFQRNWNVFGIGEPLLFPIKRAGQSEIHLARLLKEFFEFEGGKCTFQESIYALYITFYGYQYYPDILIKL